MRTAAKKNARLDVRLSSEHKKTIDSAAQAVGLRVSEFIVSHALAAAADILVEQNKVALSQRDWEHFQALLAAETEPTQAATQAARRYNEAFGEAQAGQ